MVERAMQTVGTWVSVLRIMMATGLLLLFTLIGCSDDTGGKDSQPPVLYGPQGVDGPQQDAGLDACMPVALYGPPPCKTDQECVSWMGAGWYCDQNNTFDNGCGTTSTWAICKDSAVDAGPTPDGCMPVALYGPQPCSTDQDCQTQHGPDWYCDLNNTFGDGCGGTTTWPVCRQNQAPDAGLSFPDGCMPAAIYGPQPCSTDQDCETWYSAGWTCDLNNTFSDGCGGTTTWPVCKKP